MEEQIKNLQFAKEALGMLDIKPTQNNSMTVVCIYQMLDEVIKALSENNNPEEPAITEAEL